jgi:hypothetical protein
MISTPCPPDHAPTRRKITGPRPEWLPLDSPPLPGSTGYRRATLPTPHAWGQGGSLQFPGQPSDHSTPLTPGGSSATTLQVPDRLPWPSPFKQRLGSSLAPPTTGLNNDAAGFTSCCGLAGRTPPKGACHSTSTPTSQSTPGVSYRGPWCLPGPDSHRLAILSLSPGYICSHPFWNAITPGLLDVRLIFNLCAVAVRSW